MVVNDRAVYASQSTVTDPGEMGAWLDALPCDLVSLQRVASWLVFHYRADGDFAANNIAEDRLAEIDTRYADRMLERIVELHEAHLTEQRLPHQRLVGCCRDFTVLFLAMVRHKGIPARARIGFATYFAPGWKIDHEIAEVWDTQEQRWRLVDPELHEGHVDPTDGVGIDALDVPPDRFIVAPQAWIQCRSGRADPERFVVVPDLDIPITRSWPYLVHNLLHDLAAMNKQEMVLWDWWGLAEREQLSDEQRARLDQMAGIMVDGGTTMGDLRDLYVHEEYRAPPVVTSYSPAADGPLQVSVRGHAEQYSTRAD